MRLARNLFLVAAAAIAMFAITAPAANAVEVSVESTGVHCPEVQANNDHTVTGGCLIHAATEPGTHADLFGHFHLIGEVQLSECENEFSANVHESGDGWIHNQVLSEPPAPEGPCGLTACDEAAPNHSEVPWPVTLMEFGGAEAVQVTFCTRPVEDDEGSSFGTCTVYIPLVTVEHQYELNTIAPGPSEPNPAAGPLQSRCSQNAAVSLTGHWNIEGTPIEITH